MGEPWDMNRVGSMEHLQGNGVMFPLG